MVKYNVEIVKSENGCGGKSTTASSTVVSIQDKANKTLTSVAAAAVVTGNQGESGATGKFVFLLFLFVFIV